MRQTIRERVALGAFIRAKGKRSLLDGMGRLWARLRGKDKNNGLAR